MKKSNLPNINLGSVSNEMLLDKKGDVQLNILVDKTVSNITPPDFFETYKDFCITMLQTETARDDVTTFGIVLDAYEDKNNDK